MLCSAPEKTYALKKAYDLEVKNTLEKFCSENKQMSNKIRTRAVNYGKNKGAKMKKDLNYYLSLPYIITVKRLDDGDYFAQYADAGLTKNALMAGWGKDGRRR